MEKNFEGEDRDFVLEAILGLDGLAYMYQALQLIQYLIKNGNKRILSDMNKSLFLIRMLEDYNCIDQGVDRGAPIKELAKKTTKLIQDNLHLLKEKEYEREINFLSTSIPKRKRIVDAEIGQRRTQATEQATVTRTNPSTRGPGVKKDAVAAQFGDGFLELDFEDDHEAIAQEKFYKSLAESQRMQQNEEKSKPKPKPIIKNNPPGNLLFLSLIN